MSEIIECGETRYFVVGTTPDTPEKLEPGDRLVVAVEPDGQGWKVAGDMEPTDREADAAESLDGLAKKSSLWGRVKGVFMKDDDKALGEGRGRGGPRQGMGGTDTCVCPKCGAETKHDRNTPCAEAKCPECGEPMEGKPPEEEERKALGDWAEELGDEAYKAFLDHAMETERLAEGELALLSSDELEDVVGGWLSTTQEGQKVGRRLRQKWVDDLTTWWKDVQDRVADFNEKLAGFFTWAKYEDEQETVPDDWASLLGGSKSGFKSFKGRDGRWRWVAWAASAFEDEEGEIFRTKALERYVAEAYKRGDHGKLWFYHLPLALGDGDLTVLPGESRILLKVGTWADHPVAQKAAAFFSRSGEDWGASVGYKYRPADREDKVYDWLWVFETSPVPADKAAFPFSKFDTFGGAKQVKITEDQKTKLREVFGEDWKDVLGAVESASKQLEDMGLAYKAALEGDGGDLSSLLGEMLAEEAFAAKAKANPVQMLKLALGKIKDEAAKGLVQKVVDALEKGDYQYPKPEAKAKDEEKEEEYGKPKKEKADEEEEEEETPKKAKKSEGETEEGEKQLPVQIEIEGLSELVEAVKATNARVEEQGVEITGLKAMLETGDEERAAQKVKKAPPIVAYKASIAGLNDDEDKQEGGQEGVKMSAEHPLARLSAGTPLGPRGG